MFDIGKFWCSTVINEEFPVLARVAVGILSIPASSARLPVANESSAAQLDV